MKIRMTVSMAGADYALDVGEETERFCPAEALRLIAAGFAVPAEEPPIERAMSSPASEKRKRKA